VTDQVALYIHFPWCVRKCPYCDFNSHEQGAFLPEAEYISALIADLDDDLSANSLTHQNCQISSIFLGGGTPSLFSPEVIGHLLDQIRERLDFGTNTEITMEVNPGSISSATTQVKANTLITGTGAREILGRDKLAGFYAAGINRLSIGVQSLNPIQLLNLGRIHNPESAVDTYHLARSVGFSNINIDIMHGLPQQSLVEAMDDLQQVIDLKPEHISWYQLTVEPNTVFYKRPPTLPDEDTLWQIYESGLSLLSNNNFDRYEISAFGRPGYQSLHNLNYWSFGNYLGIGAGAHGKVQPPGKLVRTTKTRLPANYLVSPNKKTQAIPQEELLLEFLMNTMRLVEGFQFSQFEENTGLGKADLLPFLERAKSRSLVLETKTGVKPTALGLQYLNDLLLLV
jgi:oxygen-independent coproporphyrinogen-3 oxidase